MRYELITSAVRAMGVCQEGGPLVLDLETDSPNSDTSLALNPRQCNLIDIQVAKPGSEIVYIFSKKLLQCLRYIPKDTLLIGQNFKFDLKVLYANGIDLTGRNWYDTSLVDHAIVNENESHSLESLVRRYFGVRDFKDDFWTKYKRYTEAPEEVRYTYGANDVYWTGQCYLFQQEFINDRPHRTHSQISPRPAKNRNKRD